MSKTDTISVLQFLFFCVAIILLLISMFYDSQYGYYKDLLVIIKLIGVSITMFLIVIILQFFRDVIPVDINKT